MKATLKKKWVRALRSGKYKQGRSMLNPRPRHYCCLGVLCRVAEIRKNAKGYFVYDGAQGDIYLPDTFAKAVGIDEMQQRELGRMNDNGQPFTEIADYIQRHL